MRGEACALGSALTWAVSVILFKRSEEISPQGLNLFKNVVAIGLLVLALLASGQGLDWGRDGGDWARLVASGVLGIALADTLLFMALRQLGPGLLAVVECAYVPSVVLSSFLLLGDKPRPGFYLGAALVIAGVLVASTDHQVFTRLAVPAARDRRSGVLLGVAAIVALAVGITLAKPALERGALFEVTLVRLLAGVAGQFVWMSLDGSTRSVLSVFRPRAVWRTLVPAAVLGSFVSMLLWLGGFKWAEASVAAVLNQMTTVFVILLGRIVLQEALTARRITGAVAALGGALLVLALSEPAGEVRRLLPTGPTRPRGNRIPAGSVWNNV